jgi:hypothetical protein
MFVYDVSGNFYSTFGYVSKKFRNLTLFKYIFPILYYESNEYVTQNNLNIDGLLTCIQNKKILSFLRNKKMVNDDYKYFFYIGNVINEDINLNRPMYISYYPNSKINYGK